MGMFDFVDDVISGVKDYYSDPVGGLQRFGTHFLGEGWQAGIPFLGDQYTQQKNEELMREQWSREDTAVQRRRADLEKAGINPMLAAGSAAESGSAVKLSQSNSAQKAAAAMSMMKMKHDITATKAQADLIKKNTEIADVEKRNRELKFSQEIADWNKWNDLPDEFTKGQLYQHSGKMAQINAIVGGLANLIPDDFNFNISMPTPVDQWAKRQEGLKQEWDGYTDDEKVEKFTEHVQKNGLNPAAPEYVHNFWNRIKDMMKPVEKEEPAVIKGGHR